jgi:Mobilization protein NikA
MKDEPRDRQRTLRVVVSATERERIKQRAQIAGMSVSSFLRTAGLNKRVYQALDWEAVRVLAKVNGDQGRLGGLLRIYLKDSDAAGSVARTLLDQIKSVQRDLAEAAKKVK